MSARSILQIVSMVLMMRSRSARVTAFSDDVVKLFPLGLEGLLLF